MTASMHCVASNKNIDRFFRSINGLQFDSAKQIAASETDHFLKIEMAQLAEMLFL
jgi:hypothetical protein